MNQSDLRMCPVLTVIHFQFFSTSMNFLFLQEENLIESIWGCVQDKDVAYSKT